MLNIYFDSSYLTVEYCTERQYGLFSWKGAVKTTHYQEAIDVITQFCYEKEVAQAVVDVTRMYTISLQEERFLKEVFIPALTRLSVRKMGIVVSRMVYNELILRRIIDKKLYARVQFSDTLEKAVKWMEAPCHTPAIAISVSLSMVDAEAGVTGEAILYAGAPEPVTDNEDTVPSLVTSEPVTDSETTPLSIDGERTRDVAEPYS